jgi:NADH dehydrogenase
LATSPIQGADGQSFFHNSGPSRSSVATANNILAEIAGKSRTAFRYDKKASWRIGRDAAVAKIGKKRHRLDGPVAFAAWLGVAR